MCGTGTGGGRNGGGGGGDTGGGGTGGGIPDPPSVEQLQCLSSAILDRDIVNSCGSVQITDVSYDHDLTRLTGIPMCFSLSCSYPPYVITRLVSWH